MRKVKDSIFGQLHLGISCLVLMALASLQFAFAEAGHSEGPIEQAPQAPAVERAPLSWFVCQGKEITPKESASFLEKIQQSYAKISGFRAKFSQESYLAALETSEESNGNLWYKKPGMMKWHYLFPDEQIFTLKENTLWLYQVADKQVLIDDISQVVISDLPVGFIMGVGNLTRDFVLKSACPHKRGLMIELEPKTSKAADSSPAESSADQALKNLRLVVDSSNYFPAGALIHDAGGNKTAIVFSQIETEAKISSADFETKFPAGTDLNDRRGGRN